LTGKVFRSHKTYSSPLQKKKEKKKKKIPYV